MHMDSTVPEALVSFIDDGLLSDHLFEIKSGKEATVHCCRAGSRLDAPGNDGLVAAKVYRPLTNRRFKNDAVYQLGRLPRDTRFRRAFEKKTEFGRKVQYALWLEQEWETMGELWASGADVPRPLARNDEAILMTYLGDSQAAAPMLHDVKLPRERVRIVLDELLENVALLLDRHRVHGDLSPYNILYWQDRVIIIDFPQAIDPRMNPAALGLLERDVTNICRWAARHGVERDPAKIVSTLWRQFTLGCLG